MQLWNSTRSYGVIAKMLHWLTVLLVILAWMLGTFGDELPRGAGRAAGLFVHMSAGLTVLLLLVFRLGWRIVIDHHPRKPLCSEAGWSCWAS